MTTKGAPGTSEKGTVAKVASPRPESTRTSVAAKPAAKRPLKAPAKVPAKITVAPAAKAAVKDAKIRNVKLVRDSFAMPESEYELFRVVKKRCLVKGMAVKKSEVLRAAIISLAALSDAGVMAALRVLEPIKTGRPPKGRK